MNRNENEFIARKIRAQYADKKSDELDELKTLDKKVKRPCNILAYAVGSIGAFIMGSGMSLVMTDIGATLGISPSMPIGISVGLIGLVITAVNYPIYKLILAKRRKKYADKIFKLSEKIIGK